MLHFQRQSLVRLAEGKRVSPRMNPLESDRLHFDLQLAYARPVIALLAALCLLQLRHRSPGAAARSPS